MVDNRFDYEAFRALVLRMRNKQKAYWKAEFKTAEKRALLIEARELEHEVDRQLKIDLQPSLF